MNDPVSVRMLYRRMPKLSPENPIAGQEGSEMLRDLISEKISQRFALNDVSFVRFLNSFGSRFMG